MNWELFKKHLYNQSSHYEKYKETIICTTKLTVSKDEWNTKKDHEECIVRSVVCQKEPLELKLHQTPKLIKPIALTIIKLYLSEGISYSVEDKKIM